MFKWPGTPSPCASKHELADYAELVCWKQGITSRTNLSQDLGRLQENNYFNGGVPEDDEIGHITAEAYTEIELRKQACKDGYPFMLDEQGYSLYVNQDANNCKTAIYKYLLLATRLNMKNRRVHENIDGTLLFEDIAAEISREYFGYRAESLVFGTADGEANFPEKVNNLCKRMKEGIKYRGGNKSSVRDGKLDIVVWKNFTDGLPGKIIAFGQCKTGTHYKDKLIQLQPSSFCDKWLERSPAVPPVRMFFISEALSRSDTDDWYNVMRDAGLLFDRCRIIDFCNCDNIDTDVLEKVTIWTDAAAKATALQGGLLD